MVRSAPIKKADGMRFFTPSNTFTLLSSMYYSHGAVVMILIPK
jgi:hypothetical protein